MDERQRHDPHELRTLVPQALTGDSAAVGLLLETLRPYLHLLVRQQLDTTERHHFGDSDIVQETMVRIHHGLNGMEESGRTTPFSNGVPQFLAWIRTIVRNLIIDFDRHDRAQKRDRLREIPGLKAMTLAVTQSGAPEHVMLAEHTIHLATALERLPQHQRDVVRWRFFEGKSYDEIQELTGKSVGALRVVCSRALERLAADSELRVSVGGAL